MDELLKFEAWLQTLDFSGWTDDDDEQIEWLDLRDAPAFESQWNRVLALVQVQEEGTPVSSADEEVIERIRKAAYFKVIRPTGNSELAAYASDDFDLLARAARVGFSDFWLLTLRAEYEAGRFPHGAL